MTVEHLHIERTTCPEPPEPHYGSSFNYATQSIVVVLTPVASGAIPITAKTTTKKN